MLALFIAMLAVAGPRVPVEVPMTLVNDHVFVDVWLDGIGPFHFIVDSGAGNLMDPAVAARIGARVHGSVQLVGVGTAAETAGLATVQHVRIGAATFDDEHFVVARSRATFGAAEGPVVDGLIGRTIVGAGVTVFDYHHRRLTFGAGNDDVVGNGATVLALTSHGGLPQIACHVAGIAGTCTVDTGSRLAVSILAPFVKRNPAIVPQSASASGIDGFGIGGGAYGRLGRLSGLSFGDIALADIPADFSDQQRGVFADEGTAANVGGGVWRRFTLTFDLPHARIALRANDDFYAPYAIDRSGLFLIVRDSAITVLDVRPGTPAARAGLVPDDVIISADEASYPAHALPALRAVLEGPAGTLVRLEVACAGKPPRMVALRLANYL